MNFNYKKICESLLKGLPQRTSDVISKRFGLEKEERETLESIGQGYDITRERVRQIAEEGFSKIRPRIKEYGKVFQSFHSALKSCGDLRKEEDFLNLLGGEKNQNQVYFLLALNPDFSRFSEDDNFYSFWARKQEAVGAAKQAVNVTLNMFQKNRSPLTLDKLYAAEKADLEKGLGKKLNKNAFGSYIEISKKIQRNPENQYGLSGWLEINPRGIKDKAFLVLKKEGKPLHFTQVASSIEKLPFSSQRKAHLATVHNELIKDQRFVLVGRGIYALKEWGYEPGVVKDIILKILKEGKQFLSKEEIMDKVLKQRLVKPNTVLLNLQDKELFSKNEEGRYGISSIQES